MEISNCIYGESKTFDLPLIEYGASDFVTGVSLATGDVKVKKDNGSFVNIATLPTVNGAWMEITLSATEMEAGRIAVQVIDQTATKIFEDNAAILNTDLEDIVWDAPLTGATHNAPTSAGRRLRALGDVVSASVDDASATVNSFITDLTGIQPDHYADQTLLFTSGNLAGMSRGILSYDEGTKEITIEEDLPEAPADEDDFDINPVHIHPVSQIVQEVWDKLITSTNHNIKNSAGKILRELKEIAGYVGGFIYYDSVEGTAGDEKFINGIFETPVDNMTDLNTLLADLNACCTKIKARSSLTFTAPQEGQSFIGEIWDLDLGGQSISATTIHGAGVSGICTGAIKPKLEDCEINGTTFPPSHFDKCGFNGDFIAGSAGDFFFADGCHSSVAGTDTPSFDYGAAIGVTNFNFRGYHGGMTIKNMKAGDNLSFDGDGQIIIDSSCTGGTMRIAGHQEMTGETAFIEAGGIISDDARFSVDQIERVTVVAGGGTADPAYAEINERSEIVQGDVVSILRYLVGDHSSKTIFFGAKIESGDTNYAVGVIQCNNISYDAETNKTSYAIPFIASDTETTSASIYRGETEIRDGDGISNPATGDRYDFEVIGQIIVPAP